jgi:hypothetical protein
MASAHHDDPDHAEVSARRRRFPSDARLAIRAPVATHRVLSMEVRDAPAHAESREGARVMTSGGLEK